MQFKRMDKWYSVSEQGYCVSAASVNGNIIFTAWPPKKINDKTALAGICVSENANDCYQACKEHFNKNQPEQKK